MSYDDDYADVIRLLPTSVARSVCPVPLRAAQGTSDCGTCLLPTHSQQYPPRSSVFEMVHFGSFRFHHSLCSAVLLPVKPFVVHCLSRYLHKHGETVTKARETRVSLAIAINLSSPRTLQRRRLVHCWLANGLLHKL